MDKVLDRVDNLYRLWALEYLNAWVGDKVKDKITGAFEVPDENEKRVEELCATRRLCVGNKCFKHKNIYKYTRVTTG